MVIRKILESTLPAGATSVSFTDTDIPNSLIRVYSTNSDLFPTQQILQENTLVVSYEAQTADIGVSLEIVKAGLDIIDNLTSDDVASALSAKQGKELKTLIDNIPTEYTASDIDISPITGITADNVQGALSEVFQSVSNGKILIADAITDKGVDTSADDTFAVMAQNITDISSGGGGEAMAYQVSGTAHKTYSYTVQNSGSLYATLSGYGNPSYGGATQLTVNGNVKAVSKSWNQGSSQAGFRIWENIPVNAGDVVLIEYGSITQSNSFMGLIAII